MNVPPAKDINMISTISDVSYRAIPKIIPIGVAKENNIISFKRVLKSLNVLCKDIARDIVSAALWMNIAIIKFTASNHYSFFIMPRAIPSKRACMARAIIRIKGVMLQEKNPYFLFA
jgi:hypothetical protein